MHTRGYYADHCIGVSKIFILKHLLNKDGQGLMEILKGDKLRQVMEKFLALFFPNVQNLVASFKHRLGSKSIFLAY